MRINPDTKDALLFATGLLGMVVQGILPFLGIKPSVPLIGAWLTMCGIGVAGSILGSGKSPQPYEPDGDDEPTPTPPRKRKARSRSGGGRPNGA